jgi:hypothetical protein
VPVIVNENRVDPDLPFAAHGHPGTRILRLLEELRDTTASIYFVPDTFVTDLIQGRMDMVEDMPVVAVCETPFHRG